MFVKQGIRHVASHAVVRLGVSAFVRRRRVIRGAYILYGHRVEKTNEGYLQGLEPTHFEQQLGYLTRHYEIISLNQLVKCYEEGRQVPDQAVVVTLDDGFRDNVTNALPILEKFGVAATLFVVTNSLSTGELPWSQRLGYVFQHTRQTVFEEAGAKASARTTSSATDRYGAYRMVKQRLAKLVRSERDDAIAELAVRLEVEPPRDRMMTWEDARAAMESGHEIGAHTCSHALLAHVPWAEADVEMRQSLQELRDGLGIESPHFCFPAGSTNQRLIEHVRRLGYRSSFLPGQRNRINQVGIGDQFTLSRTGIPNAGAIMLEAELDGPFEALRRVLQWRPWREVEFRGARDRQ